MTVPIRCMAVSRASTTAIWKIDSVSNGPEAKVVLSYVSADGEEGFPGELKVTAPPIRCNEAE